ncbi:kynurenine formamidase [Candidatus Mancarchaeum acidiphilum]|uniref:Kynurenine formamidase n=2 Tax=Candidatus Mancarchaeum acidiphilum TaxID=1920749 RepID=A0A218NMD5_9ARCH|nr:kynurenine formamidase [Candidatus Mancarchaeum acidiphilum]
MKIYDISMVIEEGMLVYPGDPKLHIYKHTGIPKSKTNVSLIHIGSHTGTHVDAERHIKNGGKTADMIPVDTFYGKCKVLNLTKSGNSIGEKELKKFKINKGDIILLKTNNSLKQYDTFRKDFAHLTEDGARYLISKKIKTLGIDYMSIKKFNADDIVHTLTIENMTLFEGIYLKGVPAGTYTFVGLPLKIKCDGGPARAILIKK